MARDILIQLRRDTAANWTSVDPVLASGEIGFETDTNKIKIGDGSTAWTSLSYFASDSVLNKYDATTAPTTGDDDGDGYSVGSVWIDVTGDTPYICVDASTGAAVWTDISGGSGTAPIPTTYANLAALVAAQGSQTTNYIYEVTDGSGFTGVDSGIVWVKYKGTTNGDETDYTWESRPSGGGSSSLEYETEITTSTTLDGSQKGLNKVYPINSSSAVQITITTGDYSANDIINIERRGQGSVEIIADTGVRIRGVRNSENKYFINDPNSMVALLCRGSEEFGIIGNLTRGYTGAVTTTSYGTLRKGDQAVDVTVTGTGFSENMIVTVSANATQSSAFTYVSATEITLHLSAVGNETDTVTVTYDNGDVFEDTDAIIIGEATYSDFVARYKMDEASGLIMSDETTNHDGDITEASINQTGKINKSYLFDGVNDYVNIPSTLGITAFPFTIKFWIKSSSYSGFKWILSFNDATKYSGFNIYSNGTNLATLIGNALGNAPGNRKTFETTDNPLIVDTWQQVIIRYTNISTIEIKIDNVISTTSSSGTALGIVFDDDTLDIGRVNRTSEYGNFEMDDLTVWDRLLTDTESNNIYTQESTGNEM